MVLKMHTVDIDRFLLRHIREGVPNVIIVDPVNVNPHNGSIGSGGIHIIANLIDDPARRLILFGLRIPKNTAPICAELSFVRVYSLFRFVVNGEIGAGRAHTGSVVDTGNRNVMGIPQRFNRLL